MGSIGTMDDSFPVEGYSELTNGFKFYTDSPPSFLCHHQDSADEIDVSDSFQIHELIGPCDSIPPSYDSDGAHISNQTPFSEFPELSPDAPDFSDAGLKFLSDILMEEDLDDHTVTDRDFMVLRATEKSLYDAIGQSSSSFQSDQYPPILAPPNADSPDYGSINSQVQTSFGSSSLPLETSSSLSGFASSTDDVQIRLDTTSFSSLIDSATTQSRFEWMEEALSRFTEEKRVDFAVSQSSRRGRKIHDRDGNDDGEEGGRSNKHLAAYAEDEVQMEQYDDILLANCKTGGSYCGFNESSAKSSEKAKGYKGKTPRGKKQSNKEDVLDLNPLLIQCAQAVAAFDFRGANELIARIREHSSPYGDAIQRVAHFFVNGLEARLAGTASQLYSDFINWQISTSSFLKAYRSYVSVVPFKRTSFFLANKTILKLCANARRVHVIDFGIFCGIQWPCFIQALSRREIGPPVLRITAVDFPERGYQPAARVEETKRRLEGYCKRFNVPFECHAIAQRWDTLRPEDFTIEGDETLVVNCMYRGRSLLDDTVDEDCPRDGFLKLIRKLNPDLFVHGVVNGTYNAPFFTTRFREALYHYSTVFDLFEATMEREDVERQMVEKGLYGKEILNIVACEGAERVERPETYKQWTVRNRRAGLRQIPLDRELLGMAKAMVKANYHKDYIVDEDRNWMLQGWKGRLLNAVSCWKPA